MTTIFGKIINRELEADIVYEDEHVIAIKDINPAAPVHLLIIPKKEIPRIQEMGEHDLYLLGHVVQVAQKLAKEYNIEEGYRLLTNNGPDAGQTIFHLHFHLLGGRRLGVLG
ncbi:MAG: histidine triad nucleotide-binding protein [Chlamydiales bacterium]|nr:histidine triad nucleotide-binding protein [Chlamydiia bacterium]MCP5506762.1 histidine triad nucleotide-binding protein [Chlamydiales bacterium]